MNFKSELFSRVLEEGFKATDRYIQFLILANTGGAVTVVSFLANTQDTDLLKWACIPLFFFGAGILSLGFVLRADHKVMSDMSSVAQLRMMSDALKDEEKKKECRQDAEEIELKIPKQTKLLNAFFLSSHASLCLGVVSALMLLLMGIVLGSST